MTTMRMEGVDNVIKNIVAAGLEGQKAAERGVEIFAFHVLAKSQEIVPFDLGDLQKHIINEPISNGVKVIGYDMPYAAYQHENTGLHHPGPRSHNPSRGAQGQAKYLERPMHEEADKLLVFVASELSKVL